MDNYKDWLYALLKTEPIPPEDIPDIGLYMDQVTTLMDTRLAGSKRYPDDKILTKTMINNYTKNHLLPPSDKKKYSREHVFLLIMIYYLKSMLSISDIQSLLEPLSEKYFPKNEENGLTLSDIYQKIIDDNTANEEYISEDIRLPPKNQNILMIFLLSTSLDMIFISENRLSKNSLIREEKKILLRRKGRKRNSTILLKIIHICGLGAAIIQHW